MSCREHVPRVVPVDLIRQRVPPGGYSGESDGVVGHFKRQQQAFVGLRPA